jgi:hypothetical protein
MVREKFQGLVESNAECWAGGAGLEAGQPGEAIVVDDDFHNFYHEGKWAMEMGGIACRDSCMNKRK